METDHVEADQVETDQTDTARVAAAAALHVVVNPASGGSLDDATLRRAFPADAVAGWHDTTEDDPGDGVARAAIDAGATTVVACGGDGTVRAVLEAVAGTDAALGVVSLGTGNLLATNLSLPLAGDDLDAAVAVATDGRLRRIDTATVNGERFAVMAGIGFDAAMIRDAGSTTKRRFGSLAYVVSGAKNLPARLVGAAVEVDGRRVWQGRTAMVLVGNCGTVTGGLEVFPDAEFDDGVLDVAVLSARRVRDWASVLWRLLRHRSQRPDLVERFRGRTVHVTTASPMPYELDGEDRPATTSLQFEIRPDSLTVRTPNDAAGPR
jgi:YegS/Rv2252/BmrU family lipid kinase